MTTQKKHTTFPNTYLTIIFGFLLLGSPAILLASVERVPDSLALLNHYRARLKEVMHNETRSDSTYFYMMKAQQLSTALRQDSLLAEIKKKIDFYGTQPFCC